MRTGARTIVRVCANVKNGEQTVIICERGMLGVARALARAVLEEGAEPAIIDMVPRESHGQEPPATVAAALRASDVFFSAVNTSITHTRAIREAAAAGARGIILTGFTAGMLAGGGIEADFQAQAPVCKAVAAALAGAATIRVTTPGGTNLTLSAEGRRGNAMTGIVSPGEFSPVPTIEANVSPVEGSASGTIVADASLPYLGIGLLREPVVARVERGMIVSISGGDQAQVLAADLTARKDPMAYNVAELGIGLNPKCRFTGLMLEDEGVLGSVHIGIGTNIALGGKVKASCHYDLIMTRPTVVADGRVVVEDGRVLAR